MKKFFSVAGYSGSGKTTLIKRLIKELGTRGYKIAVVKHDPLNHGSVDKKGSDTQLFWEAGSEAVILSSPFRTVLFRRTQKELSLETLLSYCGDVDCVILEGYKRWPFPKIIFWSEKEFPELPGAEVLALVYRKEDEQKVYSQNRWVGVPLICRDDIRVLADLVERSVLRRDRS